MIGSPILAITALRSLIVLVHEYVVELLAVRCCVACGFAVLLLFEERVGQYQVMLDGLVSGPLSSAVLHAVCVLSDVIGVDCVWFVVCSLLRIEISFN